MILLSLYSFIHEGTKRDKEVDMMYFLLPCVWKVKIL